MMQVFHETHKSRASASDIMPTVGGVYQWLKKMDNKLSFTYLPAFFMYRKGTRNNNSDVGSEHGICANIILHKHANICNSIIETWYYG